MPSKCFASWASPNWTRPPRRRDKNRSCSDQPQNPPPYLLGVTGHNVKHALVFYRKRALESGDGRTLWRAFDKTVRRKPLAGAADAAYGFSIDFRLEIVARSGIRQKRCY